MSPRRVRAIADKRVDAATAASTIAAWRARGEHVVMVQGAFDLIGLADLETLARARASAHRLVVALDADAEVAERLGLGRPVLAAAERAALTAALRIVDLVIEPAPGAVQAPLPPPADRRERAEDGGLAARLAGAVEDA